MTARQHLGVMVELGIGEEALIGLDAGPFDAESIAVESQSRRERNVLVVAVIAVAGIARTFFIDGGLDVFHQPGVAVVVVALALVGRDGSAPQKVLGSGTASLRSTGRGGSG